MNRNLLSWAVSLLIYFSLSVSVLASAGRNRDGSVTVPTRSPDKVAYLPTSAYCSCRYCCGWYMRKGVPTVKGTTRRKAVGITSSGVRARPGTVAVDPRVYPVGTVFYIPGYGYAVAEDKGGAVRGPALELWFSAHTTALKWGRKRRHVQIWYPKPQKPKRSR